MKTTNSYFFQPDPRVNSNSFPFPVDITSQRNEKAINQSSTVVPATSRFWTKEASLEISRGNIPNLRTVLFDLHQLCYRNAQFDNALSLIPALQKLKSLPKEEISRFIANPVTNHVLVHNELLKVVLIHWVPGKISNIHGHPEGGCVFKVLHGSLFEERFGAKPAMRYLSNSVCKQGSIAYIDDRLGLHRVGNPFGNSAISLHVYTPGGKQ